MSNVQYERTGHLLAAEYYERRADLAHEYGEHEDEKIFRGTVGRVRNEAERLRVSVRQARRAECVADLLERLRLVLLGGK